MKRFVKIFSRFLIIIVVVFTALIIFTTIQFNTYKPQGISVNPSPDNLVYFQESYEDCRSHFLSEAEKLKEYYEGIQISSLPIENSGKSDLFIDYCFIPARKTPDRLLILTSAVHGIEGYVGSAVQQMFMRELIQDFNLDNLGVLIIHGINPFGFKYKRRVTENNVDLNRNCTIDDRMFESVNQGYITLDSWLNPPKPVNLSSVRNSSFQVSAIQKIIKHSMGALRQATLQGQYNYEKGVVFGGFALEPSIEAITPLISNIAKPYKMVFNIDLHSGYGENGVLHLFPKPLEDQKKKAKIENIFSGYHIDWGDSDDFYTFTGDLATYLGESLPDKYYLTMTFEYGTLGTQSTMGSIRALHNMVIENQGFQNGYKSDNDEAKIKSRFLEGYYPSSEEWRSKAIKDARKVLTQAIKNYGETSAEH